MQLWYANRGQNITLSSDAVEIRVGRLSFAMETSLNSYVPASYAAGRSLLPPIVAPSFAGRLPDEARINATQFCSLSLSIKPGTICISLSIPGIFQATNIRFHSRYKWGNKLQEVIRERLKYVNYASNVLLIWDCDLCDRNRAPSSSRVGISEGRRCALIFHRSSSNFPFLLEIRPPFCSGVSDPRGKERKRKIADFTKGKGECNSSSHPAAAEIWLSEGASPRNAPANLPAA